MTNRRQFLQIGVAASAWPLASQAVRAATGIGVAGEASAVPLYKVIYDTRFHESVGFARRAQMLGIEAHAIEGDMTRLWYDDLYHRWRDAPAAIAGLTAHGPMFCLERLAWDQGMRVVFRAEHRSASEHVEHVLTGPIAMLDAACGIGADQWGSAITDVVVQCPRGRAEIATREMQARTPRTRAADPDHLYSWVIAPAMKV